MSAPVRGILFDLDDTLVTTGRADARRWREVRALIGSALPEVDAAAFAHRYALADAEGRPLVDAGTTPYAAFRQARLRRALEPWAQPDAALLAAYERVCDASIERCRAFRDAAPCLRRLRARGLRVGILTNGPADVQRRKLALTGLGDAVDGIVVSAEVGVTKPAADVYRLACEGLGLPPAAVAMIGDSRPNDVDGALAAGLRSAVWLVRRRTPQGAARSLADAARRLVDG
jgi:2-haloalkanoic acid dehalogenase type II